jgi:hypothetical protein
VLNDAQRTSLRIVMSLIEEKMRDIEARLASPEEHGLMFDVCNDLAPDVEQALRLTVAEVYALISTLRDRLALPREVKPVSREILKGLSQLWVVLQESDSQRLRRYGDVDPALGASLDPEIEALARLMLELEHLAIGNVPPAKNGRDDKEDAAPCSKRANISAQST